MFAELLMPEWLQGLFIVGGMAFWILIAVECVLLLALIEFEQHVWAFISIAMCLAVVHFLGDVNLATFVKDHHWWIGLYAIGYFAIGAAYSLWKWGLYNADCKEHNDKVFAEYKATLPRRLREAQNNLARAKSPTDHRGNPVSVDAKVVADCEKTVADYTASIESGRLIGLTVSEWKNTEAYARWEDWRGIRHGITKPVESEHASRLIAWIAYWPPSMLVWLLSDPMRRLAKRIYQAMSGLYRRVGNVGWGSDNA